jgi:hypothetical protein
LSLLFKNDKPWFHNWGKTSCYTHHTFLLGFPTGWSFTTHKDCCWGTKKNNLPRQLAINAPRHPFCIGKNQVTFQDTIFLLLRILCVFLGAFLLSLSVFFCFVCCNKWLDHIMFVLDRDTLYFHCQEHSSFHSFRSTSVLFFWYCV